MAPGNLPPKAIRGKLAQRTEGRGRGPTPGRGPWYARRLVLGSAAVAVVLLVAALGWWGHAKRKADRVNVPAEDPVLPAAPWETHPPTGTQASEGVSSNASRTLNTSEILRATARQAIEDRFPDLDLSTFKPGYIVYMEHETESPVPFVFVDWLGREALAVEKGTDPSRDRKQVRKIRVKMAADGSIVDVLDTTTWLYRNVPPPSGSVTATDS